MFVGTDGSDVAGIAQADHVANWDGLGLERHRREHRRDERVVPGGDHIYDLASFGSHVFVTGTFQNADGEPAADTSRPSTAPTETRSVPGGAGDGPLAGPGTGFALVDRQLYAAGNFTSAGGDTQAQSAASFSLTQIIAYPTPTVTAGPEPGRRRPR